MRLAQLLATMRVHGPATNRNLLRAVLSHEAFLDADVSTDFLSGHAQLLLAAPSQETRELHAAATTIHTALQLKASRTSQRFAPYGWRNLRSQDDGIHLHVGDEALTVRYHQDRSASWRVSVGASEHTVRVLDHGKDYVELVMGGIRRVVEVTPYADQIVVDGAGETSVFVEKATLDESEDAGAAGSCLAQVPGTVVEVAVVEGQHVEQGDTLVVLEAMKMEHRLTATGPGVVERVLVRIGDSVDYHQLLVDVAADVAQSDVAADVAQADA